ncbi:putative ribonuclease H-like domain-containing protein [Tanacetum coccineum]
MNYVPVVTGTNSNDFVGTKESIGAGQSSKEIGSSQDYILMPLWKDGLLFDSYSKNASNNESQPSSDARKKDVEGVSKESGIDDHERPKNSAQDVNTAGPSINTASSTAYTDHVILKSTHANFFGDEAEVDMSNITTTYLVPSTPNTRIHKDHSLDHVIGDVQSSVQTRRMTKTTNEQGFISAVYEGKTHEDLHTCLFACFLSQEEPKKVYRNKKDERGIVIRNKSRLVAQGYTQEEGIDYDEVFAPVARIEIIRLFLAYASFKDFVVYQMDVNSAFLYGKMEKEVYVYQPLGFKDPEFPGRVYKVEKVLYGLHQAPRAWKEMCTEFEKMMHKKFQMSYMGELTFFLGLQVTQKNDGIFISQDKYVEEILKKFAFSTVKTTSTPMETSKPLLKDTKAEDVDVHLYRLMIGSLMYLTASRPDIMFDVYTCARFQVTPKGLHLHDVKRIFRYLKGQPKLGLWYLKDSPFDLEAYTDSDYAGASLDKKSTTGGCQFLRSRLISWQCKKQTIVATSTTKSEEVNCVNKQYIMHKSCLEWNGTAANDAIQVSVVGLTYYCAARLLTAATLPLKLQLLRVFLEYKMKTSRIVWSTAKAKTVNNERQIHAKVSGKTVVITESSVRRDLQFNDEDDKTIHEERGDNVEKAVTIVASLDATHDSALDIQKLKTRVKKLEKKKKSRTPQLKRRLFKVRIKSSVEKSLGAQEDASKQGRNEIDQDEGTSFVQEDAETQGRYGHDIDVTTTSASITTAGVSVSTAEPSTPPTTTPIIEDEDLTISQTLMKMRSEKSKEKSKEKAVVSETTTYKTTASRPTRGVAMQEPSEITSRPIVPPQQQLDLKDKGKAKMIEPEKPLKKKDQIAFDKEIARRLEAKMQAELIKEERVARQREEEANLISWDNTQAMMEADFELA